MAERDKKARLLIDKSGYGSILTNPIESFPLLMSLMPQQAAGVESIDTFAADCSTPKENFLLGDQVCAKVTNAPLRNPSPLRRINWSTTNGVVRDTVDVLTDPQTHVFTLPTNSTTIVDGETIDNRGIWSASLNATSDSSTRAIAYFTVSEPGNAAADLAIYNVSTNDGAVTPGGSSGFELYIVNRGPDAAQNVHVTQATPVSMTFNSANQSSGPAFTCSDSSADCTISSLPRGATATITLNYSVGSGASSISTSGQADISSDTEDPRPASNSSEAQVEIRGSGAAATCSLDCPPGIVVNANAVNANNESGAVVNYPGGAESSGECGTTLASPASGTFFTVGTHTVTVTSSEGGGVCAFTVTVIDSNSPPPTIACGANLGVTADPGACDATVNVVAPETTGTGVTVEGVRNDGEALNSPYPGGITTITWTATDSNDRTVTCQQTVTVTVDDSIPPTITAPDDVTISTPSGVSGGSCGLVVGETELGTPTAADNCTVNVTRTGVPAGNFFPIGSTTITYTAKDANNHTAVDTQVVTVIEATPPTIVAPDNATYTCPSEVPAASPLQAHGNDQTLPNGGPPSDNCGVPTVAVTETRSGAGSAASPLIITRTFTATDASNNTASDKQIITVIDDTPPTLTAAPGDVVINTGASATSCGITISNLDATLGAGSASDNCSGAATVVRSGVPTDNIFPVGDTIISYTAVDAAGNSSAPVTQKVTVVDNTLPTIIAPADTTVNADTGSCSASGVALGTPTTADNCTVASVTNNAPSTFPRGDTTVIWTVTDGAGHTATAAQKVTVVDNQNPTISAPANKTVNADAGSCGTTGVALGAPTTADNCSVASVTNDAPASYPVGTTTVTWTVTDGSGHTATAPQLVTVVDNQNPTITAPLDKTLYTGAGATSCDVTVSNLNATLGTATASDNCPGVTVARGGGNVFPLGETLVTYTATDAHGNTASATQKVTVIDNTAPVVTPPANVTVQLPLNSTATSRTVTYPNPATATDNCAGAISISYSPASGSTFSVGTTTVTVTATDAHGNSASATFTVTVLYNFSGFFQPVDNLPTLNIVNAGRAIPVKFSLSGNKGLNIFAANSPYTVALDCGNGAGVDVLETLTAGSSSLSYGGDQYNYVWKTESSWAGTCRQLVVKLNDGSEHRANFKFK
jgi:hypothetical protein